MTSGKRNRLNLDSGGCPMRITNFPIKTGEGLWLVDGGIFAYSVSHERDFHPYSPFFRHPGETIKAGWCEGSHG